MNSYSLDILNSLINKYEHSKLSKEGVKVNKKIKLTTKDKILANYNIVDSFKYRSEIEFSLNELKNKDYINIIYNRGILDSVILNLAKLNDIYKEVNKESPIIIKEECLKILNDYNSSNNIINNFIDYSKDYIINKYILPKEYFSNKDELLLILNTLNNLFNLKEEMLLRDFSSKYLGDSKKFNSIKNRIINIIKNFSDKEYLDNIDILEEYNIYNPNKYVLIKNELKFKINNTIIDLFDFNFEFNLNEKMVDKLVILNEDIKNIITIENLTTFYSIKWPGLVIYLGGFCNKMREKLLNKLYLKFPNSNYYHYGDIDVGGIKIYYDLIKRTNINFIPYQMSIKELNDNKELLKELTKNDILNLNKMKDDIKYIKFKDVICYMLENNIKLEQEILD